MNIRMTTKGKRPLRSLTPGDKIHAIQRIHDGESKASVARDIGVPESTLRGWCKNEDKLRFMSRQSASDKLAADSLSDKLDGSSCLLGGPTEKRIKLDATMPLNFSSKLKYDDISFKRAPLNGLDYGTNKALSELTFNGLPPEYVAFNGAVKNKVFGADISRQADPAIAAISPLSSLTHLSGLSGLTQSPLAISFNELTSNLNLLAQLNPGLAAMSGLNGLAATASTLRNVKTKTPSQLHSPRSENECGDRDRQQGLSVKNWAKQKTPTPTSGDANYGLNLSQNEQKFKIKCPSPSLAPSLGGSIPPMPALPIADDPLLYWLKSQQAMLGLTGLYPTPAVGATSPPPPIRASTPQQAGHHNNIPPIAAAPLTPSSTPSGSLDDKNAAWFNWCKAFGASLNTLTPAAVAAMHANSLQQQPPTPTIDEDSQKPTSASPFDNILYSQLTKDATSPSIQSSSSADNACHSNKPHNEVSNNGDSAGKPEDLSAKPSKTISVTSPLPTPAQSPAPSVTQTPAESPTQSPVSVRSESGVAAKAKNRSGSSVADCKDVLDSLLYKINSNNNDSNNPTSSLRSPNAAVSAEGGSESDGSYHSESNHNHSDSNANNNNNNNSNKTDEEERARCSELRENEDNANAIKHGEKFLKWLESCSNPRVTAVQLMQLRFLISAIKSGNSGSGEIKADDIKECNSSDPNPETALSTDDTLIEENSRNKVRRRK